MTSYQAIGIGNAVVDVICRSDDAFLERMEIEKGVMQLVDAARAEALYEAMDNRVQLAGGSVANTIAGMGALGLGTGFLGRVHDDALGRAYADDLTRVGTDFINAPVAQGELPTSRCMIFVSPDGERSMNTYLGISTELGPDDVPEDAVTGADLLLLEGYLFDKPKGKAALAAAAETCRRTGGIAGISLSDPFCVDRHRGDFRTLVRGLDYVIGNEHEWASLYQTEDLDSALAEAAAKTGLVVCTRSGAGVIIQRGDRRIDVPVQRIAPVDTTGAGDQFAAGFLYGLTTGATLDVAGRMGCIAAAEVISHYGARPEKDVKALFAAEGLI
ncbi:adenosine kinase [Pelagivirga sediminicola]|uniref:Adenosine kinase n=1 Tax=Pelagivirga sediminicola TaxID=2170575 RepID=A0A2T7G5P5_9RHOB|nr:adenosine kinase [Pelagivirga sediminicola]PVA09738.1 adenosine kinase [Pelagivirga sediminicola]